MLDLVIGINSPDIFLTKQNLDNNCDLILATEAVTPNGPDGQDVQVMSEDIPYILENCSLIDEGVYIFYG